MTLTSLFLVLCIVAFILLGRPRFIQEAGRAKLVVGLPQMGRVPHGARLERCKQSPQWQDGKFHNEHETPKTSEDKSMVKALREFLFTKHPNTAPEGDFPATKTDLHALPTDRDWIVWFGHSSYLVQLQGQRLLVDPVFYSAAPVQFIEKPFSGTNIYKPEDMPAVDCLVITHNHYDHLDYETVRNLKEKVRHVVCPLGVGESLELWGFPAEKITEMDWWQTDTVLPNLTCHCTPARHFSGRMLHDGDKTLWGSFVFECQGRKIYVGGDSGYDTHFKRIGDKYGPFDVAFMENGQYNEDWRYIHTMPEEMLQECLDIQARQIFSVHHGKFALAYHTWDEPYKNIDSLRQQGIDVLPNHIGEVVYF